MKKKLLLVLSIICMAAALAIIMAVPVMAAGHGISVIKDASYNSGTNLVTATITIKNVDSYGKHVIINSVTDTVYFSSGTVGPTELLGTAPNPNVGDASLDLAPGASIVIYGYATPGAGDFSAQYLGDTAWAYGNVQDSSLHSPVDEVKGSAGANALLPLPELSAGLLFGFGVLGLGGFVVINRRKSTAKV
jgi:hypothetical protein